MRIKNSDPRIDTAIKSYKLVELPDGFTDKVMKSIRQEYPHYRFHLQFIDVAIPLFLSLFFLIFLGVCVWGMNLLDPLWLEYLRLEIEHIGKVIITAIRFEGNVLVIFIFLTLLVGSFTLIWLIYRPRKILRI
jgi:hypothetical protein